MQKRSLLFPLLLCLLFIVMIKTNSNAQTGLNFQGVARSSNNVIIASQQISLRLSILQGSSTGNVEYSETRKVTTNAQGLFAVVIGDADATSTMGIFNTINWKNTPKYLKIEMDATAGNNYTTMGTTQFQYVAYAQFASSVDAENIVGVVPVARGGTGATNLTTLKSSLALDKVNNTADADKPISSKTQTALDLKLNAADSSKFTKQSYTDAALLTKVNLADTSKYTKQLYTDSSLVTKLKLSDTASMLSNRIGKDTLNLSARINLKANTSDVNTALTLKANASELTTGLSGKVDKVTGKELSTNDYTSAEKTKLAAITGTNTGDQDLSAYATTAATNTALALKANTADVNTALNLKANASDITTNLNLKEDLSNKSIATDLGGASPSDILYPTQKAVKAYITANSSSGGVADGGITTIKLADAAVTDAKITTGISKSKVGLGNVENTALSTWTGTNNISTVGTITTGTWSGTSIALANGGTGGATAAAARTNLGLVIGSDILAYRTFGTAANSSATDFVAANASITGATKTKITYDTKGVVTAGADATTADITPSTNRNYITDAQSGVISNTSGTNTGDETRATIKTKLGIITPTITSPNDDAIQILTGAVGSGELLFKDLYDINTTLFDDKASLSVSQNTFTGDIKAKTFILTNPTSTTASTSTTNINLATGNVLEIILNSSTTLTFSNPRIGTYIIKIKQDGTGGRTVVFPTMKWADNSVPIITSTANRTDLITLIYDGIDYYASCLQNF